MVASSKIYLGQIRTERRSRPLNHHSLNIQREQRESDCQATKVQGQALQ